VTNANHLDLQVTSLLMGRIFGIMARCHALSLIPGTVT
jgi:hypothetical protein